MKTYQLSDDQAREEIKAANLAEAKEAAVESWKSGSWDGRVDVEVRIVELDADSEEIGPVEWIVVECGDYPTPPACAEGHDHEWLSPFRVVGGIKENPGVWSRGGTTTAYLECCPHCGTYKHETRYGVQRNPGQCDEIEYRHADDASLAWVESLQAAE